jgi:hypothetical protein
MAANKNSMTDYSQITDWSRVWKENTGSTNADWQSWKHKRHILSLSNDSLISHPKCDSSYGNAPCPVREYCRPAVSEKDLLLCFTSVSTTTNQTRWHSLCVENPDTSRLGNIVFASERQISMQISPQIYSTLGRIGGELIRFSGIRLVGGVGGWK